MADKWRFVATLQIAGASQQSSPPASQAVPVIGRDIPFAVDVGLIHALARQNRTGVICRVCQIVSIVVARCVLKLDTRSPIPRSVLLRSGLNIEVPPPGIEEVHVVIDARL